MDLRYLKGVGEKRALLFKKLGVDSVDALLSFYPRTYEDWSKTVSIIDAPVGEVCCIRAYAHSTPREQRIRKGLSLYKTRITDGEAIMNITIFNSKYMAQKLVAGQEYLFYGKVSGNYNIKEMNSPLIESVETGSRIRPIYPQTEGLSSKIIENAVKNAYELLKDNITDCLPREILQKYRLFDKKTAIKNIHFPESQFNIEQARKRLIFEELLIFQIGMRMLKSRNAALNKIILKNDYTTEFQEKLPFKLTNAQLRAIKEAVTDMKSANTMNRLLQGDVGSGKTAVAAALIYNMCKNGYQSAMMAPTEILAQQHFATINNMLTDSGLNVALLTGSTKAAEKRAIKESLKNGEIDIIVGTHALIQDDVQFKNLGLVVTDEQHRFGVKQRNMLNEKGDNPHILVMSATPIPRTLALIIYGDLSISVLDEMPAGRQKIETYCINSDKRARAYNYVKKHLDEGRQGYIVCPMVEESESEMAAAVEYAERISTQVFRNYRVAVLHGKMKPNEKEKTMTAFSKGEIDLLVSTTVIEVGVDVPNAVIMIIENAERFGLSQLHQLRGRIGRGQHKSTCILISDAQNDEAAERLKVMKDTTDGFKIADMDLKLRGPGDFFGARQHGLPDFKIADMMSDMKILNATQKIVDDMYRTPDNFFSEKYTLLRDEAIRLFEKTGSSLKN